ncbi:MAG: hypothetical protein JWR58_627 [Pseudonocardia sp.]|nr:hypothetical protein [Pseudonocardia sp.]
MAGGDLVSLREVVVELRVASTLCVCPEPCRTRRSRCRMIRCRPQTGGRYVRGRRFRVSQRWGVVLATLAIFGWAAVQVWMLVHRPGPPLSARVRVAAAGITALVGICALVTAWAVTAPPAPQVRALDPGSEPPPGVFSAPPAAGQLAAPSVAPLPAPQTPDPPGSSARADLSARLPPQDGGAATAALPAPAPPASLIVRPPAASRVAPAPLSDGSGAPDPFPGAAAPPTTHAVPPTRLRQHRSRSSGRPTGPPSTLPSSPPTRTPPTRPPPPSTPPPSTSTPPPPSTPPPSTSTPPPTRTQPTITRPPMPTAAPPSNTTSAIRGTRA